MLVYYFQVQDGIDWMLKYFFIGGIMLFEVLLLYFQEDLCVVWQWWVSGVYYVCMVDYWLVNFDVVCGRLMLVFVQIYGELQVVVWFQWWCMFYLVVLILFGYVGGNEWGVVYYWFVKCQLNVGCCGCQGRLLVLLLCLFIYIRSGIYIVYLMVNMFSVVVRLGMSVVLSVVFV